ncbi:MAG TPA: GAF domain-containing protein [Stellaceae bacterium]|nr:GAF domain-containing protein [Stellaceae bacterium]
MLTAHAPIEPLGWLVFVELPMREALAPLYAAAERDLALLLLGLLLASMAALLLARRMVVPIRAIAEGASRLGRGELDRRIEVKTGDELEALAGEFNQMAGELQKSYAELEGKVEARTAELSEALDQQTATAEVLGVINSSPGNLAPVFEAMLEKAIRLCGAAFGTLWTYDGQDFRIAALLGVPSGFAEFIAQAPDSTGHTAAHLRLLHGEDAVHVPDLTADEAYRSGNPMRRALVDLGGARTLLAVPLRKEGRLLGVFSTCRREVRPFTDKQIALVENFAAQAVIAMENARLITETREALEQQTATAEVLGVINSSPGDLAPVFGAMLDKALGLCSASFGVLWTYDGEYFQGTALRGVPETLAILLRERRRPVDPTGHFARLLAGETFVNEQDITESENYRTGSSPLRRAYFELAGTRSQLAVALRKDQELLGMLTVYRTEVRPFSDKEIALLQNFAAQAVIAMENARLINETREALEQQTATAEVLGVINSSPGDLAPVFDAMLDKAMRLCEASFGIMFTVDGERARMVATRDVPTELSDFLTLHPAGIGPDTFFGRAVIERSFLHTADVRSEAGYRDGQALAVTAADLAGVRALLMAPLLKDDGVLGVFAIFRQEVRPFSDKQIALLQNFAAQAVIAIENARLITETREALEQQTATAEVLGVINSSPGELKPVFDAILEKAHSLCGSTHGALATFDGENFRAVATHGLPAQFVELISRPYPPYSGSKEERLVLGDVFVHIPDVAAMESLPDNPISRAAAELTGVRTVLLLPLRKDGALLGYISAHRKEIRPFTDKQIALLQNFAAQAVIAMENARLINETREALEQQTATAEVLGVINSSPGDLAPVFEAMLERAMRLCEAAFGQLSVYDGERFATAATKGVPAAFAEYRRNNPPSYGPGTAPARILAGERVISIEDLKAEPPYAAGEPNRRALVDLGGARSDLLVALTKDGSVRGFIEIYRQEVRPFTEKQIALLENFAAQAVIAMENARLITETREALEQQTATAEVLGVINSSPGDLAPVFEAMLEKATRLCDAAFGVFLTYDGEQLHTAAVRGATGAYTEFLTSSPHRPGKNDIHTRLIEGEAFVQFPDVRESLGYRSGDPMPRAFVDLGGGRTVLAMPLRRDNVFLGEFAVYRREVRPFSDKQIALLQNFAAQAVIAMENARLITETREALEQQTATAEVLQVINASPGDLAPVFDAMLDNALRLCEAAHGHFVTYDGEAFRPAAVRGESRFAEFWRQQPPFRPAPGNPLLLLVRGEPMVHRADAREDEAYRDSPTYRRIIDRGGVRTSLMVPLRREGALLGAMRVYRQEVRPFSDKQIALLQNFAAQAVIAMENARLITETREALEQQTATAEVLQVINSSPGDLAPVFDAMLEKAARICRAESGFIFRLDDGLCRMAASFGIPPEYREFQEHNPIVLSRGTLAGRTALERRAVHIKDAAADPEYNRIEAVQLGHQRTMLGVPLIREDVLVGVLTLARSRVEPFSEKDIELVRTFAAQAVIAMENARLITETREALEQQTATAEVLGVINSSPGDLAPVFDVILDKAHTLCGSAHGSLQLYDGENLRAVAAHGVSDAFAAILRQGYRAADSPASRALIEGKPFVHIADCAEIDHAVFRAAAELAGIRTVLFVPLRKDDLLLGLISAARREVQPFTEKQIALLENFAAQAVIAMENARLITETREALEQQTATAEVLGVINSSPGDLAPVFDAMLEKAVRLCEFPFASLWTYDGTRFAPVAFHNVPPSFEAFLREHTPPGLEVLREAARPMHLPDVLTTELAQRDPVFTERVQQLGPVRTLLLVPLRKDSALLGAFVAYRQEVRPFSDKHIALLENFAAQAVIAMENARLITETREALEQQTATAEILGVINASPGDLGPVFEAMLEKATRLCAADAGVFANYDGECFLPAAWRGFDDFPRDPMRPHPDTGIGRVARGEDIVHILDSASGAAYESGDPGRLAIVKLGGARSQLTAALRKESTLLGSFTLWRREVRPFTDKQIALLQSFAAQAVIAMENARLINETREALEQQTATAEVLGVINSSPGDLAPVFDAMLEKALRLCEAAFGILWTYDGERYSAASLRNVPSAYAEFLREPQRAAPSTVIGQLAAGKSVAQIADISADEYYQTGGAMVRQGLALAGFRTVLGVALRRDDALLGAITVYRQHVQPFPDKQIALLQNFAAQAVIAMENARLITETREALEQQTATAEVLGVINSSPGNLAPVFDTMLERAMHLCEAAFGGLWTFEGERYVASALRGVPTAYAEFLATATLATPGPGTAPYRFLRGERVVHNIDMAAEEPYRAGEPNRLALVDLGGARTALQVPLEKDDAVLGVITIYRQEVRPFSDKQIALLQNFAAQAVIAMENARLITETREALEQQTATAEVLQVINSSPGDLAPVFDAMLEKAMRLCEAVYGVLWKSDGQSFRAAALRGVPADYAEFATSRPRGAAPDTALGQLVAGERFVHIADVASRRTGDEIVRKLVELGGVRTLLAVPLRKDGVLLGSFAMYRRQVRPFTDKQIALLENFAAQAVIAMENARLINETREALEQQTATAEVLQVINASPGDLSPVFEAILEKAHALCGITLGELELYEDGKVRAVAIRGVSGPFAELLRQPFEPPPRSPPARLIAGERTVQITDVSKLARHRPDDPRARAGAQHGLRTALFVPLRKDDALLGYITGYRREVRPFSQKEIALLQNFAAQAVIAMENTRLLGELRERTAELGRSVEELKLLSEVGQAVSSTLDLRSVLSTVLTRSVAMTGVDAGAVFRHRRADRAFHLVEAVGWDEGLMRSVRDLKVPESESAMGEAAAKRTPIQLADVSRRSSYPMRDVTLAAGFHAALIVPLVGPERVLGALILMRRAAGEFPPETLRLMQTLASQSVLAIQNARLFRELAEKSEELELASQHKSQFLANMSHELRTPLNAILGYAELLADGIYGEMPEKPKGVLERIQNNGKHLLALINDVLDLAKIEAGQLTLSLEDYSIAELVRSVVTATEPLAAAKGLKFAALLPDDMPTAHGDARRISQVLLNLVGNAIKFTDEGEVEIAAAAADGHFTLTVRDTGPGIAEADRERIFGEFQQIDDSNTRKKGGTGLGLAISKRMVEMQGGTIAVESALGQGSTFRVTLPVYVEERMEAAA